MKNATGNGIGLCTLLTVLFVALKLCRQIDWSWWWVLAPLWMPWAAAFAVLGLIGTIWVAVEVCRRATGK
jgi:hypothetical protein